MTVQQFVAALEGYYGTYRPGVKAAIEELARPMSSAWRAELYRQAIRQCEFPPNVAMLLRLQETVAPRVMGDLARLQLTDDAGDPIMDQQEAARQLKELLKKLTARRRA